MVLHMMMDTWSVVTNAGKIFHAICLFSWMLLMFVIVNVGKIIKVTLKGTDKWIFKVILLLLSLQTVLLLESALWERKKEKKLS